jgi:hypothetical protein
MKRYVPEPDAPMDYGCDLSATAAHVDPTARTTKPLPPAAKSATAGGNKSLPMGAIARAVGVGAGGGDGPSRATYGNSEAAAMGAMLNGRFPSR